MIFDYLVDIDYLVTNLKTESGLILLHNLTTILRVGNGRLVVPVDKKEQTIPDEYYKAFKPFENRKPGLSSSRITNLIDIFRSVFLQKSVAPKNKQITLRKIHFDSMQRSEEFFIVDFCKYCKDLLPKVMVVFTDNQDCEGSVMTFDEYFNSDSKLWNKLYTLMGQQTIKDCSKFSLGKDEEGEDLVNQLKVFGAAETEHFEIYDPYILREDDCYGEELEQSLREKVKLLFLWIDALIPSASIEKLNIYVYSTYSFSEEENSREENRKKKVEELKSVIEELIEEEIKELRKKSYSINIEIKLLKRSRKLTFHDRYICSSTHYFSIGKGLDAPGRSKSYSIHYCGKLPKGVPEFVSVKNKKNCSNTITLSFEIRSQNEV